MDLFPPPEIIVERVIDGDTIELSDPINGLSRIRLEGIDTPETRRAQCRSERKLGYEAKGYARGLMEGKRVRVRHKGEVDRYKRLLVHIEIDGHDYSQIMLEKGYAVRWTKLWRATPKHKRWCDGKAL